MSVLELPDCVNARDLGGLRLGRDSTVADGALLRSDNLDLLTPSGVDTIRAIGVSRILDLRFMWEARKYPGPFSNDPIYVNLPLIDARDDFDPDAPVDYRPEIDLHSKPIAAALTAFVEAPPGAVLVHCHAGRDRTGMFVALALATAGATSDVIVTDYTLSDGTTAATMSEMLEHLERQHGGARNFLQAAGMSDRNLDALVHRLTGSPRMN